MIFANVISGVAAKTCIPKRCLFPSRAGQAGEGGGFGEQGRELLLKLLSILGKCRGVARLNSSTVCEIVRQSFVLICSSKHMQFELVGVIYEAIRNNAG